MSRGDYPKTDLRLPVMGTDGEFHDVYGYIECYWDCHFFFFHMPDDGAVVYKIGDTCYTGMIPMFHTWKEVTEHWLSSQEKYWGESRYKSNFCPPVALEESLAGWRIVYQNAYEYEAFSDSGKVVRINFREGKVRQSSMNVEGVVRYYFPHGKYITEDGFLVGNRNLGKLNLEATLNCSGKYYIMEDGTTYSNYSFQQYYKSKPYPEIHKCKNGFYGKGYWAFHYMDDTVKIFTSKVKKYGPLEEKVLASGRNDQFGLS